MKPQISFGWKHLDTHLKCNGQRTPHSLVSMDQLGKIYLRFVSSKSYFVDLIFMIETKISKENPLSNDLDSLSH